MRARWLLIALGVLAVVLVLYGQGYLSGVIGTDRQSDISVVKGWNTIVIPDDWHSTTAKAILNANPEATAITYTDSSGNLHSYLSRFADAYSFTVTPGMSVFIYVSMDGSVVAP